MPFWKNKPDGTQEAHFEGAVIKGTDRQAAWPSEEMDWYRIVWDDQKDGLSSPWCNGPDFDMAVGVG